MFMNIFLSFLLPNNYFDFFLQIFLIPVFKHTGQSYASVSCWLTAAVAAEIAFNGYILSYFEGKKKINSVI